MSDRDSFPQSENPERKRKLLEYFLTRTGPAKSRTVIQISQFMQKETSDRLREITLNRYLEEFRSEGYDIRREPPSEKFEEPRYYYKKMQPAAATTDCKTAGQSNP